MNIEVELPAIRRDEDFYQLLDADGLCDPASIADLSRDKIIDMYRLMVLTRMWNDKALSLQRQGRLGTIPSVKGQEAAGAGMAFVLQEDDWFVPAFREAGALFHLGIPLRDQYLFWGGDERGGKIPDGLRVTNVSIIVAGHLPHAVGIAYAAKYKKENSVVIAVLGDGATSEGDFHESLNMAAVLKLPIVFVIQNNGWAISTPLSRQSATRTLAEKAAAYAMDGRRADGNDVFAVYKIVKEYADRARSQFEPALIELVTYRIDDHTTADDASRYRPEGELEAWRKKDPIERLKKYMQNELTWSEAEDEELHNDCAAEVETAVKEYLGYPKPDPRNMFKYMYNEMPWNLKEELQDLESFLKPGEVD